MSLRPDGVVVEEEGSFWLASRARLLAGGDLCVLQILVLSKSVPV